MAERTVETAESNDDRREVAQPAAGMDRAHRPGLSPDGLLWLQRTVGNRQASRWLADQRRVLSRQAAGADTIHGTIQVASKAVAEGDLAVSFADTGKLLAGATEAAPLAGPAGAAGTARTVADVASKSEPAIRLAWEYQKRVIAARAAGAAEQAVARVVLMTVVRAGVILFFVVGPPLAIAQIASHEGPWESPWAAYGREVEKRLGPYGGTLPPGGAPPPAQAPGGTTDVPAVDPDRPAPGQAPAPAPSPPAQAPGQQPGTTAEAPDIVDDPGECYRLITKGITHDHHIFPQTLRDEFARIGINIDDYTITIPASRHIGPRGVHIVLDWNDQWHVFFDEIPTGPFSPGEQATYRKKAIDMAIDLLHIGKMDGLVIHPYRKSAS